MPDITAEQKRTYDDAWSLGNYGDYSPGAEMVGFFRQMTEARQGASVLDAGCGSGAGALKLAAAGFHVAMCDLTDSGLTPEAKTLPYTDAVLWRDLRSIRRELRVEGLYRPAEKFDYVYCCDVLEHLPTEWTMLAVSRMLEASYQSVFLSIHLEADHFGILLGTPLHLTVKPFTWWRDNLSEVGRVLEARDLVSQGVYVVASNV